MLINTPVSIGEVVDKVTILAIKSERIKDKSKLENIIKELELLRNILADIDGLSEKIESHYNSLKSINEELWDIEDDIRIKEYKREFDDEFISLARSVYVTNDKRAEVKKQINLLLGSELVEEKSYEDYQ